jgi:hypothetical protein
VLTLWSVAVVCLTVLVILERLRPFAERVVALRERAAEFVANPPRQEATSIPPDLFAMSQAYTEPWAREQALQAIRELYGELGNWDLVRVRVHLPTPNEIER